MINKVKILELNRMTKDELIDKIDGLECALLMEQKRSARRQERIDVAYEAGFFDAMKASKTDIERCLEKITVKLVDTIQCSHCPAEFDCNPNKDCGVNIIAWLKKTTAKELKEANHEG